MAERTRGEARRADGRDVRSDLLGRASSRAETGGHRARPANPGSSRTTATRSASRSTGILQALGVEHAAVEVEDRARCRSSSPPASRRRRGGPGRRQGDARPEPAAAPLPRPRERNRLRRSRLYLPGNEPKYFVNAGLHGPDGVILDLEDSVHPSDKDAARLLVRNALRASTSERAERMVRINQLPLGLEDLEAIVPERPGPDPDPQGGERPTRSARSTTRSTGSWARSASDRPLWLMPILETGAGHRERLRDRPGLASGSRR